MLPLEIRIWDKETKKMSHDGFIDIADNDNWDNNTSMYQVAKSFQDGEDERFVPTIHLPGMIDRKGRKIFSGDICRRYYDHNPDLVAIFRVVFENLSFGYYWIGGVNSMDKEFNSFWNCDNGEIRPLGKDLEVIGDEFRNPELLKGI